jgi:uncharacterized cupin superfamily protein/DNA-binding XRE family transcriptional regulator
MTTLLPESQNKELEPEIQSQLNSFGAQLRELRLRRGWTLEELACRSGLSKAFLSRLESGGRQASISAALTLAKIFDVSLASLFESPMAKEPCAVVRAANLVMKSMNGLRYTPLSHAGSSFNLQPIKVTVPTSRQGDEHYHHAGEEWIYLLAGALTLSISGHRYDLSPGDAAHFDSRLPHRLISTGKQDAEVLLVASSMADPGPITLPSVREYRAIMPMRLQNFRPLHPAPVPSRPRQTQPRISKTKR